ncbi:hypothetical protein KJ590_03730 [Patescibacteria group bacterium]|nr:hypothetical protein [Patescibacteria group bacterium]MBU4143078.1 hypothetical protein [Patescibacteria group bacterium]
MKNKTIKNNALHLRNKGYSYNLIAAKLKVSKSTLSCWLKDVPFSPNNLVLKRIKTGPFISGQKSHEKRVINILKIKSLAKKELGIISKRDLWMVGIGLYIGEGSKIYETIRIINSDPKVIALAIKWFKHICNLEIDNITIAIHLYPDNDVKKCLKFWSKITGLPIEQFRKTQIDKRQDKSTKKKRKLPYGTAHLTIVSNGNTDYGVNLHRKITGWIEGVL